MGFCSQRPAPLRCVLELVCTALPCVVAGAFLEGQNAELVKAAQSGDILAVKALLAVGAHVEASSANRTALSWAAEGGHMEVARALVEAGADLDAPDNNGYSPLFWAGANAEMVELLLAAGAHVDAADKANRTALSRAAKGGHTEAIKALLAAGAGVEAPDKKGNRALSLAAIKGHTEAIKALLAAGADVEAPDKEGNRALSWAASNGHLEATKVLLASSADVDARDDMECTPLSWSALAGEVDVAKALLAAGASVNAKGAGAYAGYTPLFMASNVAMLKALLEAGADPDAVEDQYGSTTLLWDSWEGKTKAVEVLLESGANTEIPDTGGETPLTWAAQRNHTHIFELLLTARADVRARNFHGDTALMSAARNGYMQGVKALLAADADPGARDVNGKTALLKAAMSGQTETAEAVRSDDSVTDLMIFAAGGQLDKVKEFRRDHAELIKRDGLGRTVLSWAAMGGDAETVRELLRLNVSNDARDVAGLQARDFAIVYGHQHLLSELPETSAWRSYQLLWRDKRSSCLLAVCAVLMAVVLGTMDSTIEGMLSFPATEDSSLGPSRGAVLVAAKKSSSSRRQLCAKVFRFAEVFCNAVIPMRLMLEVWPPLWVAVLVLAYLLPALLCLGMVSVLQEPLSLLLVSTRRSILWGLSRWTWHARISTLMGVVRTVLLVLVFTGMGMHQWCSNPPGMEVLDLLARNRHATACPGFHWRNLVTRPWHVASGECHVEGNGCISTPAHPDMYPSGRCTISVDFPFFIVTAKDFMTAKRDYLTIGSTKYSGLDGPTAAYPGLHITWESAKGGRTDAREMPGWRICPGEKLCLPLPSVSQTWWLSNSFGSVLLAGWFLASVMLAILPSVHFVREPQVTQESSTETDKSSTESEESGTEDVEGVLARARRVDEMVKSGNLEDLDEIAVPASPTSLRMMSVMLILHVGLQLNTVNTLLLSQDVIFAGCLLAATSWTTVIEIASGGVRRLPANFRKSIQTRVPTEGLLSFLDNWRGSESLVTLFVSSYALPFATRTPFQMLTGILSVFSATWSLAMFVHDKVDLSCHPDDLSNEV
mmetsp:Transcript_39209/g.113194  ORF Transcript_39209/g.113194 Transcript_39209/m.113194 type:complete len:1060 (-) Transcript_39209:181-3360(-)